LHLSLTYRAFGKVPNGTCSTRGVQHEGNVGVGTWRCAYWRM